MKSFKNLEKWAEKKERKIVISHEQKDREALRSILEKLKNEQYTIIKELHYVDYLIDLANNSHPGKVENSPERFDDYRKYKGWLKELKKALKDMNNKPKEDLTSGEREFLIREKARLQGERERLEKHLKATDELIAKNTILLIDVEETYCRELSKGHSISSVAESLKMEFGSKIEKGYSEGRRKFVNFLEKKYNIKRHSALELVKLLIERKMLKYCTKIPRDKFAENLVFYTPYMDDFMDEGETAADADVYVEPLFGTWVIDA